MVMLLLEITYCKYSNKPPGAYLIFRGLPRGLIRIIFRNKRYFQTIVLKNESYKSNKHFKPIIWGGVHDKVFKFSQMSSKFAPRGLIRGGGYFEFLQ